MSCGCRSNARLLKSGLNTTTILICPASGLLKQQEVLRQLISARISLTKVSSVFSTAVDNYALALAGAVLVAQDRDASNWLVCLLIILTAIALTL